MRVPVKMIMLRLPTLLLAEALAFRITTPPTIPVTSLTSTITIDRRAS